MTDAHYLYDKARCCVDCGRHRARGHEPDCAGHSNPGLIARRQEEARIHAEPRTAPKKKRPVSETKQRPTRDSDTSDTSDTVSQEEIDSRLLAGLKDGAWLDAKIFPPLQFSVPGLIPEGLTVAIGPPKVGKSYLFGGLLLAVAAGGHALGQLSISAKRPILNLALEDGDRRQQDRCRQLLGRGVPIPQNYHYVTEIEPGRHVDTIEAFLRRQPETSMVVLDTLGRVATPAKQGESTYERDYRVIGAMQDIAKRHPGLSVVIIHHDRKAQSNDFIDSVSGTHGIAGAADMVMVLCRDRQSKEGLLKITGRDVAEEEYALKVADGAWLLDGRDLMHAAATARKRREETGLSGRSVEIIDYVRKSTGGASAQSVRGKFGPNADQYLRRLTESGKLSKPKRGLYVVPEVSEVSEVSEDQVSLDMETDT